MRLRDLLAGKPETTVVVVTRLPGTGTSSGTLTRTLGGWRGSSPATRDLRDGVIYINLAKVEPAELEALYPKLADAKAVIFDVRSYPRVDPSFLQHLVDQPLTGPAMEVPVISEPFARWSNGRP